MTAPDPQQPHWQQHPPPASEAGAYPSPAGPPAVPGYGQPGYPPPYGYQQASVTTTGLPGWMRGLYAVGGLFTCGVLWLVWLAHWWFVKSKSQTTTVSGPAYPPNQGWPPQ